MQYLKFQFVKLSISVIFCFFTQNTPVTTHYQHARPISPVRACVQQRSPTICTPDPNNKLRVVVWLSSFIFSPTHESASAAIVDPSAHSVHLTSPSTSTLASLHSSQPAPTRLLHSVHVTHTQNNIIYTSTTALRLSPLWKSYECHATFALLGNSSTFTNTLNVHICIIYCSIQRIQNVHMMHSGTICREHELLSINFYIYNAILKLVQRAFANPRTFSIRTMI